MNVHNITARGMWLQEHNLLEEIGLCLHMKFPAQFKFHNVGSFCYYICLCVTCNLLLNYLRPKHLIMCTKSHFLCAINLLCHEYYLHLLLINAYLSHFFKHITYFLPCCDQCAIPDFPHLPLLPLTSYWKHAHIHTFPHIVTKHFIQHSTEK